MATRAAGRSANDNGAVKAPNASREERAFLERNRARLSKTTLRAKWIHSPDEHEDRPGQTLATRSRDVVKAWAEARDGRPATTTTIREGERPRTLRFDFPIDGQDGRSGSDRRLKPIDWQAWLDTFESRHLVFLFQEHRRNGGGSNFFRLDSPDRERG